MFRLIAKKRDLPLIGLLLTALTTPAHALDCDRMELISGWGAGGGTDRFLRNLAPALSEVVGVPIKVLNITGAMADIARQETMSRPADGCTLVAVTNDAVTADVEGIAQVSIVTDLVPLHRAHMDVGLIHVRPDGPFASWQELVEWAKANPGKLNMGGTGVGFDELANSTPLNSAGVADYNYIPYDAAGTMHADLMGGRLHGMMDEISVIKGMIDAGQIKPVLVLAHERLEVLPDVPSAGELGLEVPASLWRGAAVKMGTPLEIIEELSEKLMEAAAKPSYAQFEADQMLDVAPGGKIAWRPFTKAVAIEYAQRKRAHDMAAAPQ